MCFCKFSEELAQCSLDNSVITLAQQVESTGTRGDRSINSFYSRRYVNNFFFIKEWGKKKKRNPEVISEESDKTLMVKQKRSDCGIGGRKQESRKWEIKENEIRSGFEKW